MKIANCDTTILVKQFRRVTSIGGVSTSIINMKRVIVIVFLSILTVLIHEEETEAKTTDTGAMPQGESVAHHMVKVMGSVDRVISDFNMPNNDQPPPWVKDFKAEVLTVIKDTSETLNKDITSKVNNIGKDLADYKEHTGKAIEKVEESVSSLTIQTQTLADRVEKMEREKSSWEKKVESDMAKLSSGTSTVTVPGYATQEDLDEFDIAFSKMERTIGLAPFTHDDMANMKRHLTRNEVDTSVHNIMTGCIFDFWRHDMGCSEETIETLAAEMEKVWLDDLKTKDAAPGTHVIFVRFTTVQGRLTMYTHAKAMNRMCKKRGVEFRKLILDICPQLERRFGALNKLQHRFRKEQEEKGEKVQTRIFIEDKTIHLQYRMEDTELYRTLDVSRAYPDTVIPEVRYNDKVPFIKKPKAIKYEGNKTPPGRMRSDLPIMRPESRSNPALATITGNPKAASALSKDLLNLDLVSFDPLTSTSKSPNPVPQYRYDITRSFRALPGASKEVVEQLSKSQSEDNILEKNRKRKQDQETTSKVTKKGRRNGVRPTSQPDLRDLLTKIPPTQRGKDDQLDEGGDEEEEEGFGDDDTLSLGSLARSGNY